VAAAVESLLENGDSRLWLKASGEQDANVGHWVGVGLHEQERPDDRTP
jgi:hypothetical protein